MTVEPNEADAVVAPVPETSEVEGVGELSPTEEAAIPTASSNEPTLKEVTGDNVIEEKKETEKETSAHPQDPWDVPRATEEDKAESSSSSKVAPTTPERTRNTEVSMNSPKNPAAAAAAFASPGEPSSGKGAQILMNRFQSIRERANQNAQTLWSKGSPALSTNAKAVQERAGQFWKQAAPKLPTGVVVAVPGFRNSFQKPSSAAAEETKLPSSSSSTHTTSSNTGKDETNEPSKEEREAKSVAATSEVKPKQFSLSSDQAAEAAKEPLTMATAESFESVATEGDSTASTASAPDTPPRLRVGRALTQASLAATVAYESVLSTGFRGRYNTENNAAAKAKDGTDFHSQEDDDDAVTDTRPVPESQLELILKSRAGPHMQEILDKLEPHEYAMLLGRGMLGVNLKQCYLKHHGVFVDFLVPGGQAEMSGIVRSGDLLVKLGDDLDLRKGTILDIPVDISKARRPIVLFLATGTKVSLERMNYVDVAVALMHRARDYYTKRGTLSNLPSASSPTRGGGNEPMPATEIESVSKIAIPAADTIDSFLTPPAPTLEIRQEFLNETPLRCLDKFLVEGLCQVHDMDSNFREAVRNAFLTCALDGRRLPFLSRHFSSGEEELVETSMMSDSGAAAATAPMTSPMLTASAQLMLFLELTSFLDLYHVTPQQSLREKASKIAHKFFLPTTVYNNKLQPPLFDFHHMVPDVALRRLEAILKDATARIPQDAFLDFCNAVVDSLTGAPFLSFLTSSECARMRAYLRNTAPYAPVPLHDMMQALSYNDNNIDEQDPNAASAKNYFAYMLLFLICQVEKEPSGEYNFATDAETKTRLLGASNDLCCSLFIRRTFLPALQAAKTVLDGLQEGQDMDEGVVQALVDASEKFWSIFVVGTMELSNHRRDKTEATFHALRQELERVSVQVLQKDIRTVQLNRETAEIFVQSRLQEIATTLAEEMVYHFASNVQPKFREHKFHEWMCTELSKVRAKDHQWNNQQLEIPLLPQGCVKRLLRKADLPSGVSSHKPFKHIPTAAEADADLSDTYPNAEFAVVFGSSVGTELASEMPVPGIEASDIRRYTCLPVALDCDIDPLAAVDAVPPTFEGYGIVPPLKRKPFSRHSQSAHFSEDGWEVSLVSFTIPNAESSGASSSLYGVSLFFQCKPELVEIVQDRVDAFVHQQKSIDNPSEFQSPIQMTKTDTSETTDHTGELGKRDMMKNVRVSEQIPAFNDKHKSQSWVSRVLGDGFRDPNQPISIGLALVSRQNVMLSMRDTLSRLLFDYAKRKDGTALGNCGVLVDVLGNFAYRDVESISLRCILEPYLRAASAPWIERPIDSQAAAFETMALQQLNTCLPPTPLSLMFITALLEQKIILSSSRRSILHAATTALCALLDPLKWSHLLVPLVPSSLAVDLIQYPAPFILGVPSEEAQNAELIGNLPRDVTLVDLDVGRVILAPQFGVDNEMVRKSENPNATANALRSQVLYLAQSLGAIFGNSICPESWLCDAALPPKSVDGVEALKSSAKGFVSELLEGVSACCYWIEEAAQADGTSSEPTVLFDEDRFFEIKNHGASQTRSPLFPTKETQGELALTLTNFDLVLESFMRCQSMSTYISSRPKTEMVYY